MPEDKEILNKLNNLINKASAKRRWLMFTCDTSIVLSPQELKELNEKGDFICDPVNWELIDPKKELLHLDRQRATAVECYNAFKQRMNKYGYE